MALEENVAALRAQNIAAHGVAIANSLQGVDKEHIANVLKQIDRATQEQIDAVFALLDDVHPSWFSVAAKKGHVFYEGATTAHIACHMGILQRDARKLDREGRDYWLKPLWEIGALEKCYYFKDTSTFIPGHPKAKSPYNCYRLAEDFKSILLDRENWSGRLDAWISEEQTRARLRLQAEAAENAKKLVENRHSELIQLSATVYKEQFLAGYVVVYIDDSDGDRITTEQKAVLEEHGITLTLADVMPDVLLISEDGNALWVIEAVTSDGEVDLHKKRSLIEFAHRNNKQSVGFTTSYLSWKDMAVRQGKHKNIAPGTYVWIAEEPAKQLYVEVSGD